MAFGSLHKREILAGLGLLAAGAAVIGTIFVRELDAIVADAASDTQRTLDHMAADAGDLFHPAVNLIASVDDAALMRLARDEARRTFHAIAQGPVQRSGAANSVYIGFPDGEFWQHREVLPTFLEGKPMNGVVPGRGYRRTIRSVDGGMRSFWSYFSAPTDDWVEVPEPGFNYDPRTRPWYSAGLSADRPVWTEPYRTASSNDFAISLAAKLTGSDGKAWGVVGIDFLIAPLNGALGRWKAERIPPDALLLVVDAGGSIVARPPGGPADASAEEKALAELAKAGRVTDGEVEILGRRQLVAISPLGKELGLPLSVAVAVPLDVVTIRAVGTLKTNAAILAGILVVLAAIGGYAVKMRGVARDIGTMAGITHRIAGGEFDVNIEGTRRTDAIGGLSRSIEVLRENSLAQREMQKKERELARSLSEMAEQVGESADAIRYAASEISQGSDDLAARTERQAATLQNTITSISEISATVTGNAENSDLARRLAADALARAEAGGRAVTSVVGAMSGIEVSSARVTEIVQVIEEISFQTKLLALNAAVEAARAGDSGKGFAVVAQEVRALADRSRQASQQIGRLIAESSREVGEGVKLAGGAGDALARIIEIVRRVAEVAPEIAAGSREQAVRIAAIVDAIGEIDATTQQNAALVEESSAASASLASQAAQLVGIVARFRASGSPAPTPGTAPRLVPPQRPI